jgi:anaerobic magnesium-protoporphyrin IX monomethyl ester cyclase
MARVTLVTSGLEHLGVAALAAYVRAEGHEASLVYEPNPFSSNSGPDSKLLARWLEPTPQQTAERVLATKPDLVGFSSYTITHRWSVEIARAIKARSSAPIVFGGPHASGAPAHVMREPAIDAVVEGEGEGALVDLLESAREGGFSRTDVKNTWFKGRGGPIRNPLRPLIDDLDALPFADKSAFYEQIPAFEREFYVISRRGCPYRCSFCEYSIFPRQYPGEKPVRRRSVDHLMRELSRWKARGRIQKVFFWDAIFTLDARWMQEFARRYAREIGVPFECYTHPHAMTGEMARLLADAGCGMARMGVQTVNSETLASMDRKGDRERVAQAVEHLRGARIPYALDHILGLPGEGPEDQREAVRFYNAVRPARIIVHWMTYLPGTTALERAREDGTLSEAQVERVLSGEQTEGFEAPRLVGPGAHQEALKEIQKVAVLFDLMPVLPARFISALLESGIYRRLPRGQALHRAAEVVLALVGDAATRERIRTIVTGAAWSALVTWERRWRANIPKPTAETPPRPRAPAVEAPRKATSSSARRRLSVL